MRHRSKLQTPHGTSTVTCRFFECWPRNSTGTCSKSQANNTLLSAGVQLWHPLSLSCECKFLCRDDFQTMSRASLGVFISSPFFAFPYVCVPKASTGVGICGENVFQVSTDFTGPGKVFKQVISSLRQEVLIPSLLQWGEKQQEELLPGFGQRILRLLPSSQPSDGEGVGKMPRKWLPF